MQIREGLNQDKKEYKLPCSVCGGQVVRRMYFKRVTCIKCKMENMKSYASEWKAKKKLKTKTKVKLSPFQARKRLRK